MAEKELERVRLGQMVEGIVDHIKKLDFTLSWCEQLNGITHSIYDLLFLSNSDEGQKEGLMRS